MMSGFEISCPKMRLKPMSVKGLTNCPIALFIFGYLFLFTGDKDKTFR